VRNFKRMSSAYSTLNHQPNDAQAIQRLIQSITQNIQKIAQNVSQIENMNIQIGTSKDSEALRERLLLIENGTNILAKDTNKQLKELNHFVRNSSSSLNPTAEERQFKIQKERLTNDLVKTLNKFQEVQKLTMQKQKESNERVKANLNNPNDNAIQMDSFTNNAQTNDFQSPQQKSQQAQVMMEQDVNLVQLREREAALHRLENDIVDVNMIFKDLAVMVHDQGEVIDSIESNVENVQIRVSDANTNLEQAKKSQQAARKKKFIFFSIIAGVLAIILLIIILSVSLDN